MFAVVRRVDIYSPRGAIPLAPDPNSREIPTDDLAMVTTYEVDKRLD